MKILIVDDEAPARQRLRSLVEDIGDGYEVADDAANGEQALACCRSAEVDLVLMDIRMPGMDGIEAAAQLAELAEPPAVIFVTAFEEHALEAFQGHAVDYLLKPIRRSRLERALSRVSVLTRPQLQMLESLQQGAPDPIVVSYRGGVLRIEIDDVVYFQAEQKYVTVCHSGGEALLEESLKSLEGRLGERFFRIHRNALVSARRIVGLEKEADGRCLVRLDGSDQRLEISRRHLPEVRRWIRQGRQL